MSLPFTNVTSPSPAANSAPARVGNNEGVKSAQMPNTAAGISNAVQKSVNAQILQASANVSIKAGEQSLALLYRSAIDRINEVLAPELGANAIQNAVSAGIDTSPEATAGRILAGSTAFFEGYAAQHPGKDREQLATDFVALIRGGFEKGFNEAKHILAGLGVLKGDIADGIQRTYDLVQKGYDDFLTSKLNP
ncbi:MAG: DUF5610 domain-containing protein [Azoarcus sp.]|nr:DUF5610 domain-containing protein [Azoarcus sp.]